MRFRYSDERMQLRCGNSGAANPIHALLVHLAVIVLFGFWFRAHEGNPIDRETTSHSRENSKYLQLNYDRASNSLLIFLPQSRTLVWHE